MRTDRDYRMNQKAAQVRWSQRHPDYWKEYRRRRMAAAAGKTDGGAKMDAQLPGMAAKMDDNSMQPVEMTRVRPGRYILRPFESFAAKMDEIAVELTVISGDRDPWT